jgi:hypothetical protein
MKQLIGTVTPAQRDEIKTLYERKKRIDRTL